MFPLLLFSKPLFVAASTANGQNKIVTLQEQVKSYNSKTNACFFVDPQMVSAGVAAALGNKTNNACVDQKFGKGALISFDVLQPNSDYPQPPRENVLIEVKGYWKLYSSDKKEKVYMFVVTQREPFF